MQWTHTGTWNGQTILRGHENPLSAGGCFVTNTPNSCSSSWEWLNYCHYVFSKLSVTDILNQANTKILISRTRLPNNHFVKVWKTTIQFWQDLKQSSCVSQKQQLPCFTMHRFLFFLFYYYLMGDHNITFHRSSLLLNKLNKSCSSVRLPEVRGINWCFDVIQGVC